MIFLTGFNAICIEIRDMYRFSEIGNVSLDFVHELSRLSGLKTDMFP